MNSNAERTVNNLFVLGAVSQNDKLMTNDDQFDIYVPTTWRGIARTWYGERRSTNVQRIRDTIRAATALCTGFLDDANQLIRDTEGRENGQNKIRIDTLILHHMRLQRSGCPPTV